tara:strand:+ start:877 stop:2217 length:1341 start_codon:yes stop_codon:yes gene_type:complete
MPLNEAERRLKLKKIKEDNPEPLGSMMVYLDGRSKRMATYDVPLDALIYNPKNGRIRTKVLTHENRYGPLDQDNNEEDFETIGNFIYESAKSKNEKTIQSLKNMGQQTPAVVTAHGVVVGGNRRLCCFHRTKTLHSMECVILDERYSQNASALLILEKTLQHAVDAQEDYGATEKYFECYDLVTEFGGSKGPDGKWTGIDLELIRACMPRYKSEEKIIDDLQMKELIEEYLKVTKAPNILTQADEKEGYFVDLLPATKGYQPDKDSHCDRKISRRDIAKWKEICFYVAKAQFQGADGESKMYRPLFQLSRAGKKSIFGNKDAWELATKIYDEKVLPHVAKLNSYEDLKKQEGDPVYALEAEEKQFQEDVTGALSEMINRSKRLIEDEALENFAEQKVRDAHRSLERIEEKGVTWPPNNVEDLEDLKRITKDLRQKSEKIDQAIRKK